MEKSTTKSKTTDLSASSSFDSEKGQVATGTLTSWGKNILLSVETRGIERVTEEERQQNTTKVWNACTFWYIPPPKLNLEVSTPNLTN
jgi:hypothetical protein